MINVHIVCAYDAAKLAETLMRLLEAEQHRVRLSIGRQALGELEAARTARDAVLLIWSPDARSQTYMIEWGNKIDATRRVEIALTPDSPRLTRKAPVIDFSHWRGERGERAAWYALNDRLRVITRTLDPPKPPPKYAAFALGMASAAAMTGAVVMRMNDTTGPIAVEGMPREALVITDPGVGLGGPMTAIEPGSLDDDALTFRSIPDVALIHAGSEPQLVGVPNVLRMDVRDATLLERLNALNPLREEQAQP